MKRKLTDWQNIKYKHLNYYRVSSLRFVFDLISSIYTCFHDTNSPKKRAVVFK